MINPKIVFFGTPEFSVKILEEMKTGGFLPILIITAPDKQKGRGMKITASPVKTWAQKHNILVEHDYSNLKSTNADLFVVASFGKILSKHVLEIPKCGTLNVHPSLLPKLRGASPIQTAILNNEKETGVTIMLMNEKMDEGPILARRELEFPISNFQFSKLENELARMGGKLLTKTIPKWLNGKITPIPQKHSEATYTKLLTKKDGEINWSEPAETIYRKIRALNPWPSAYAFHNGKRIIVTEAELKNKTLLIKRAKEEGKKETTFEEFKKNNPDFCIN